MLSQIRAFAKSPVATVLMTVLLISFVIFGIRGVSTSVGARDEVVKAPGRPAIGSSVFRDRFNFVKRQLEQQNQQPVSTQEAVQHDVDKRLADELAASESFAEYLKRLGIRPADQLVVEKIRAIPAFFNPITGAFDKDAYQRFLHQNDMTALQAEGELRDEIAEQHFQLGMASSLRAPLTYSALQAAFAREARDFSYFVLDPKAAGDPVKPTDAQLNGFIKENAARLMKPELRVLSYLRFQATALAPGVQVSDADVQKRFDFEKDALSTPEKRTFQQIAVKDAKTAGALQARLRGGEDPAAAAKALQSTAIPYVDQPRSAVPDRAVADAAFSMAAGETRSVSGDLGPAVVHLSGISPGKAVSLSEARARIEGEIRKAGAEKKAYDMVQAYDDQRARVSDMAAAAKAVGTDVTTTPPLAARGVDPSGKPSDVPPKALQAAFATAQGQETQPIKAAEGDYWILKVDKILPPALPSLDEIRPQLTRYFVLRDTAQKLQAKAQALAASMRKGQTLSEAAASAKASVLEAKAVARVGSQAFSPDLLGRLFEAKAGEVVVGEDVKLGYVVAKLDRIAPADAGALAPMVLAVRGAVTKSLFEDMGQDVRFYARALVKPRVDYLKARQALGVEAAPTTSPR